MLDVCLRRYAGYGGRVRVLLIDTCGEIGSVALAESDRVIALKELPARTASSVLLQAIRNSLSEVNWQKSDVEAVGVVSGPGSFTGVRVGLAAAKGLCEAHSLPLAAVSRLAVLAHLSGLQGGYAVMNAGRGELYVREIGSEFERLYKVEELLQLAAREAVAVDEPRLVDLLAQINSRLFALNAGAALPLVLKRLQTGGDDVASIDANYVRSEQEIYGKQTLGPSGVLLA